MDLVAAVKAKDEARVRALLVADPKLAGATTSEGMGVLQLALYLRASRIVDALLDAGAQPNVWEAAILGDTSRVRALIAADPSCLQALAADGAPPLHYAAHFGRLDTVKALLSLGADVRANAQGPFNNTALHAAVAGAQVEVADALLRAGADANAYDGNGYAPLHVAAATGIIPLVQLLLRKGADTAARTKDGRSAADVAREREHTEAAALLALKA